MSCVLPTANRKPTTCNRQPATGNQILIGIDASRTTAQERTGTENYSLFLIRALLKLDQNNQYRLYFNQTPALGLFPATGNAEIKVMPFPRLWTHVRLSLEMATRPPDVLFVPAHVLPLIHPRRSVVTVHDLGYLYYPQAHTRWARWYLRWSTCYNARSAVHLIADSQATRRDLIEHCRAAPERVTVIYPGYDPSFAPVQDEAALTTVHRRYGISSSYVIYVGTLQPRKNLTTLLDAFAALTAQGHTVHLVIAGKKGWLYEPLFARVQELGLQGQVHFVGYVPQADLPALLSGAQAFVLPSLYEGFGLPVLEAMACATPVICSKVSSLPEVAGDAAIWIDPRDTAQLVQALGRVLEDADLRRDMAAKGLRQVSHFSWEKCAQETLRLLEDVGRSSCNARKE
jgi:glycosyltransferase involved in cell wall biosynthesis